jgi:hypothetical protein
MPQPLAPDLRRRAMQCTEEEAELHARETTAPVEPLGTKKIGWQADQAQNRARAIRASPTRQHAKLTSGLP